MKYVFEWSWIDLPQIIFLKVDELLFLALRVYTLLNIFIFCWLSLLLTIFNPICLFEVYGDIKNFFKITELFICVWDISPYSSLLKSYIEL